MFKKKKKKPAYGYFFPGSQTIKWLDNKFHVRNNAKTQSLVDRQHIFLLRLPRQCVLTAALTRAISSDY